MKYFYKSIQMAPKLSSSWRGPSECFEKLDCLYHLEETLGVDPQPNELLRVHPRTLLCESGLLFPSENKL